MKQQEQSILYYPVGVVPSVDLTDVFRFGQCDEGDQVQWLSDYQRSLSVGDMVWNDKGIHLCLSSGWKRF